MFQEKIIKELFDSVDTDKSGAIDPQEFHTLVIDLAQKFSLPFPEKQDIEKIIKNYDDNDDGLLQFSEFKFLVNELFKKQNQRQAHIIDSCELINIQQITNQDNKSIKECQQSKSEISDNESEHQSHRNSFMPITQSNIFYKLQEQFKQNQRTSLVLQSQIDEMQQQLQYGESTPQNLNYQQWLEIKKKRMNSFARLKQQQQNLRENNNYLIKKINSQIPPTVITSLKPQKNQLKINIKKNIINKQDQVIEEKDTKINKQDTPESPSPSSNFSNSYFLPQLKQTNINQKLNDLTPLCTTRTEKNNSTNFSQLLPNINQTINNNKIQTPSIILNNSNLTTSNKKTQKKQIFSFYDQIKLKDTSIQNNKQFQSQDTSLIYDKNCNIQKSCSLTNRLQKNQKVVQKITNIINFQNNIKKLHNPQNKSNNNNYNNINQDQYKTNSMQISLLKFNNYYNKDKFNHVQENIENNTSVFYKQKYLSNYQNISDKNSIIQENKYTKHIILKSPQQLKKYNQAQKLFQLASIKVKSNKNSN